MSSRRAFLRTALCSLGSFLMAGCAGAPSSSHPPSAPPLPPLRTKRLTDLLPLADLRWLILAKPKELADISWLVSSITTVVPEQNLDRFETSTGIDPRKLPEVAMAAYETAEGEASFYLLRHRSDPAVIERSFRRRLTVDERRAVERPDLIRLSGKIGLTSRTLVIIGSDVAGFQVGGNPDRGPARIASLYATGKLKRSPSVLAEEAFASLAQRFGPAPVLAFARGPFEGELARGARGLLSAATAIGAAARPSVRQGIALAIAVAGDFSSTGEPASDALLAAWNELALGSLGHLLGLNAPIEPPLATFAPDAVAVAVELDPKKLAQGLRAATSADMDEIMR